jgi:hypothetical protein
MYDIKTGLELELWVIDSAGRLCDGQNIADASSQIQPEFIDPLIEVQTEPHGDESGLRHELQSTLRTAIRVAEADGKHLVPLGTPLTESNASANCERGRLFKTLYGDDVTSAKNCAGTHVHFEKRDVKDQLNVLTALDPALALVSSSPYYLGTRREDCARAQAYRKKYGPEFQQYCDLWGYADSVTQWNARVERMYDLFREQARRRGISPETVDRCFTPEDTVLNPVRLRECQPTVEWRAPDSALPSQVIRIATDVGSLVSQLDEKPVEFGTRGLRRDCIGLPTVSELRELSQQAIDTGLQSTEVRTYLRQLGFDSSQYQPRSPQIRGPRH